MSRATFADSTMETLREYIASRNEPAWMTTLRGDALERSAAMEWPTTADEEFRRSDVRSYDFTALAFDVDEDSPAPVETPVGISGTLDFHGTSLRRASLTEGLADKGVVFTSFARAFAGDVPETLLRRLESVLRRGLDSADNRISLTHYAAITHGAVLYVPRFLELEDPFVVTFDDESGDGAMRVPQVVVITDEGARAVVVERIRGVEEGDFLWNESVLADVGNAGQVRYYATQDLNLDSSYFSASFATVGRDARLEMYNSFFGAMFTKARVDVEMAGEGSDAFIGGVYFPTEDQHMDMRTVQRHVAPHAHSDTLYKGAITDEARSVYQGLIHVFHEAVQTDAYLTNNNLVLSDEARSDSIPTLEIHTDDVRCSHGSTTGRLDQGLLNYVRTRGFSLDEARRMLVEGYFEAILSRYPETVLEEIHEIIDSRITGA